jgi:ATP-dependent RNA helicase RhlE
VDQKGNFVSFDKFMFDPQINAGIVSAGYTTPTPIQEQTIQPVLDGRDVMGLAQTGTGKTAAFVLPILQHLHKQPRNVLRALVLSPTRELAEQTHTVFGALGKQTRLRSLTLYGGVGAQPQIRGLRAGIEIAVACPGRLLDLMGQGEVDLRDIQTLVIDEADQMFDMGFLPSIRRILAALPKQRQTLLFSATMPSEIRKLALDILRQPVSVEIGHSRPVETVKQQVFAVEQEGKYQTLLSLLNETGSGQVLIFTRTKHRAKRLAHQLAIAGHAATSLQGNLSQNQRQIAMDGFRSGRVKVMVATDIAARGIDVTQVTHVINFDVPDTAEAYTHRIGRTGRMERLGTAFTLATQEDQLMIRSIERLLSRPLERVPLPAMQAVPSPELDYPNQRPPQHRTRPQGQSRPAARPTSGASASAPAQSRPASGQSQSRPAQGSSRPATAQPQSRPAQPASRPAAAPAQSWPVAQPKSRSQQDRNQQRRGFSPRRAERSEGAD